MRHFGIGGGFGGGELQNSDSTADDDDDKPDYNDGVKVLLFNLDDPSFLRSLAASESECAVPF